jgi:hypothetical protein
MDTLHRAGRSLALGFPLLVLLAATLAAASETSLTGAEGHPRDRFPLALHVALPGKPDLDAAIRRAVDDWNALAREVLGVQAFAWTDQAAGAQVTVTIEPRASTKAMGETQLHIGPQGVITPPVRIVVYEPAPRGQTPAATLLYQVVAHELGHALGSSTRGTLAPSCAASRGASTSAIPSHARPTSRPGAIPTSARPAPSCRRTTVVSGGSDARRHAAR